MKMTAGSRSGVGRLQNSMMSAPKKTKKKKVKTFDDEGNTQVADVKHLEDQFLLKKLQNTGGNIRKSKLLNKSIKKTLGKKDKFKKDR